MESGAQEAPEPREEVVVVGSVDGPLLVPARERGWSKGNQRAGSGCARGGGGGGRRARKLGDSGGRSSRSPGRLSSQKAQPGDGRRAVRLGGGGWGGTGLKRDCRVREAGLGRVKEAQ